MKRRRKTKTQDSEIKILNKDKDNGDIKRTKATQ